MQRTRNTAPLICDVHMAQTGDDLYVTLDHQTHLMRVDIPSGELTELGASGKALFRSGSNCYVSTAVGIRRIRLQQVAGSNRKTGK